MPLQITTWLLYAQCCYISLAQSNCSINCPSLYSKDKLDVYRGKESVLAILFDAP